MTTSMVVLIVLYGLLIFCLTELRGEHRERRAFEDGYLCGYSDGKEDSR